MRKAEYVRFSVEFAFSSKDGSGGALPKKASSKSVSSSINLCRCVGIRIALGANSRRVLGSVFARAGRQLGGGIIAGNSLILLLAWRTDSLTADLLVSSVIASVIMAAVGVLACAAPARRALRIQPTEALRQG